MKNGILLVVLISLFACHNEEHHEGHQKEETMKEHAHHHKHGNEHHEDANKHMHKSSTEDLIKRFESEERDEYQRPDKVLEYLGALEGKTVIDIGAGSGYFSVKLAANGAQVIAADVNDEFLAYMEKRIADNGLKNIELRKVPYDSPSLEDEEADMAFIVNTYHHIENRAEYFAKVKKGTKPSGELVVIDFFKTDLPIGPPTGHKISIDEIVAELKEAGYSDFEVNASLLPYQYIIKAR